MTKFQRALAVLAGLLLLIIGLRFLIWPLAAQHSFGLGKGDPGMGLHQAVGLRDLWLALLAIAFVWSKNWPALALWFAFGAAVCLGDAVIVAAEGARWPYIGFHVGSGIFCATLAALCFKASQRASGENHDA